MTNLLLSANQPIKAYLGTTMENHIEFWSLGSNFIQCLCTSEFSWLEWNPNGLILLFLIRGSLFWIDTRAYNLTGFQIQSLSCSTPETGVFILLDASYTTLNPYFECQTPSECQLYVIVEYFSHLPQQTTRMALLYF